MSLYEKALDTLNYLIYKGYTLWKIKVKFDVLSNIVRVYI
jgi:hypothetical protein